MGFSIKCPLGVKLRNTRDEQISFALPPITDILGDRLARLSSGGRECFHSISNMASALPAPEQADKVSRSLAGWKLDSFYSFVIGHEIPFAYERPIRARSGRSRNERFA